MYKNGISSTRRIKNLIRKLGKDEESREIITNILVNKFKYENKESNYNNKTLDLDMNSPDDYMSNSESRSLIDQYIEKKDSGDYVFDSDEEDPMKEVASILDGMKEDQTLIFLSEENKEKIVELGTITHHDPQALKALFDKIRFRGNPNSRFGFLSFEDENFIGLVKYKNTLVLIANKECISPRLLMNGLSVIMSIIYDYKQNQGRYFYFSELESLNFKLTGFNAKVLSSIPNFVLNKMSNLNGNYVYQSPNLKVIYDDGLDCKYFKYLQKYQAEPLYNFIEKMCIFNPELAIPCSFIEAKKFNSALPDKDLLDRYSHLDDDKQLEKNGWKVKMDKFKVMNLTITSLINHSGWGKRDELVSDSDDFVFKIQRDKDFENKKIHIYPKYKLKGNFLTYTKNDDFNSDKNIKSLNFFQKEIASLARSIFGNYVSIDLEEGHQYFSALTMAQTGKIIEGEKNIIVYDDITNEKAFSKYYDSLSEAQAVIASEKVLKRSLK